MGVGMGGLMVSGMALHPARCKRLRFLRCSLREKAAQLRQKSVPSEKGGATGQAHQPRAPSAPLLEAAADDVLDHGDEELPPLCRRELGPRSRLQATRPNQSTDVTSQVRVESN